MKSVGMSTVRDGSILSPLPLLKTKGISLNGMKKQKRLSVELTLSWEFDEKDWKELQQHQNDLKENQKIVLGEDLINTLFSLNELDYPSLKDFKVINK